jgi:hypothetical protein
MFRPKKTIPKLAVAMLALTGCSGDGGDGGGGSAGNGMGGNGGEGMGGNGGQAVDFSASLNAFCQNVAPCPQYQLPVQGCINYYNEVNQYNADANCTAALLTYFDCGATNTCDDIYYYACLAEYNALWAVCDELPVEG